MVTTPTTLPAMSLTEIQNNTYTQTQVIAPQSACSALTWLLPLGCIAGDMENPTRCLLTHQSLTLMLAVNRNL